MIEDAEHKEKYANQMSTLKNDLQAMLVHCAERADELTTTYGIDPTRLHGEGVAFLAPVASNETDAGREKNRRVELVRW